MLSKQDIITQQEICLMLRKLLCFSLPIPQLNAGQNPQKELKTL